MTKNAYEKIRQGLMEAKEYAATPCFCVGPQNGEPMCPCAMRNRYDPEYFEKLLLSTQKPILAKPTTTK